MGYVLPIALDFSLKMHSSSHLPRGNHEFDSNNRIPRIISTIQTQLFNNEFPNDILK